MSFLRFARIHLLAVFMTWAMGPAGSVAKDVFELSVTGENGTSLFSVEVADDDVERARGLMYRRSMADNSGMLFDFGDEQNITMWMRNTYISLDMLFIDANGRIGHIATNTTPLSDTIIPSRIKAQFVLEINAGIARQQGIEVGDRVHGPAIDDRL